MVSLAFSTNAYTDYSLLEAVERIAGHGYAGVEILGDEPHAYFPSFDEQEIDRLATALADVDVAVANVNANTAMGYYDDAPPTPFFEPSVIRADDSARRWRIEYTKRAIDLAAATGAPAISLTSGQPVPGTEPAEAERLLHESLREILEYADEKGVDVGIEYEPDLLVGETDDVLELVEAVGHDRLGVNLDVGHAAVSGEDVHTAIRRAAGHITGVHLEDIVGGRGGTHYHRIPGEGDLDFRAIFDAFDDVGYDGYATLELYTYPDEPDRAARESFEALARYL
ncbi:sugar phosphate isomerase/epimerase [Halomicroarcula sp. F13]|uniref:Sugar phosphate isomerase/epimerase n=1 Tax=Haloarcula rubra TaxID=2487747 RepID=A0AAW4PPE6_9EURY|nr:sugar phosphate isomerase/epimerase family protein [Halomicroarcula rubra]MBX0323081.1 sugar phosphate isomerase/epimerase [Halomicroarcula rubra]